MILVDTNVVIDITGVENPHSDWSRRILERIFQRAALFINEVVVAETVGEFGTLNDLQDFSSMLGIEYALVSQEAAYLAGQVHLEYRRRGGSRSRTLPDFFIGAQASTEGWEILTRDPAGFRSYFPSVPLITPDTHPT